MGRTYSVPRNVKGETRLLYIFSIKSLLFTIAFGLVGVLFFFLFKMINLTFVGIGFVIFFAVIGFIVGKAGGESISDILFRLLTFKKRKRIYLYRGGNEK